MNILGTVILLLLARLSSIDAQNNVNALNAFGSWLWQRFSSPSANPAVRQMARRVSVIDDSEKQSMLLRAAKLLHSANDRDSKQALTFLHALTNDENSFLSGSACAELARVYLLGAEGRISLDIDQARNFAKIAHEKGSPLGSHMLAFLEFYSIGSSGNQNFALEVLKSSAKKDYVLSMLALGYYYRHRDDCDRSKEYYRKVAHTVIRNTNAKFLGDFSMFKPYDEANDLLNETFIKKYSQYRNVFVSLLSHSKQGEVDAFYELGKIHKHGLLGVRYSLDVALQYFRRASDQGHVESSAELGFLLALQDHRSVKINVNQPMKDLREAVQLLRYSTQHQSATGLFTFGRLLQLGYLTSADNNSIWNYYTDASLRGNLDATWHLCEHDLTNNYGTQAYECFANLSKSNHVSSIMSLAEFADSNLIRDNCDSIVSKYKFVAEYGLLHDSQFGLRESFNRYASNRLEEAIMISLFSAFSGVSIAAYNTVWLAMNFFTDRKLPFDPNMLKYLLDIYIKENPSSAVGALLAGKFYEGGFVGIPSNKALAASYYEKAMNLGSIEATWALVTLLTEGIDGVKDLNRASELTSYAMKHNHELTRDYQFLQKWLHSLSLSRKHLKLKYSRFTRDLQYGNSSLHQASANLLNMLIHLPDIHKATRRPATPIPWNPDEEQQWTDKTLQIVRGSLFMLKDLDDENNCVRVDGTLGDCDATSIFLFIRNSMSVITGKPVGFILAPLANDLMEFGSSKQQLNPTNSKGPVITLDDVNESSEGAKFMQMLRKNRVATFSVKVLSSIKNTVNRHRKDTFLVLAKHSCRYQSSILSFATPERCGTSQWSLDMQTLVFNGNNKANANRDIFEVDVTSNQGFDPIGKESQTEDHGTPNTSDLNTLHTIPDRQCLSRFDANNKAHDGGRLYVHDCKYNTFPLRLSIELIGHRDYDTLDRSTTGIMIQTHSPVTTSSTYEPRNHNPRFMCVSGTNQLSACDETDITQRYVLHVSDINSGVFTLRQFDNHEFNWNCLSYNISQESESIGMIRCDINDPSIYMNWSFKSQQLLLRDRINTVSTVTTRSKSQHHPRIGKPMSRVVSDQEPNKYENKVKAKTTDKTQSESQSHPVELKEGYCLGLKVTENKELNLNLISCDDRDLSTVTIRV